MAHLSAPAFAAAMAITLFAGFVKGAVGFAMPMIMMAAFSSFLPPELALAGLMGGGKKKKKSKSRDARNNK